MDGGTVIDPIVAEMRRLSEENVRLAVELDRARQFILRMAEQVFVRHEVIQKRAEKRCDAT